ncbi:HAD-IIA family hydrolase [Christensenellaceae bacterium OttesenSCG-928-K19]|nr:HAD-IIA family hydrolase [Christensenellaceae bacterium OttesenSCG-928-K19]
MSQKLGKINPQAADLKDIECYVLDMDGTICLGDTPIDGAHEMISLFQQRGIQFYFFTNNSSKAREGYVKKLERLGFKGITPKHIMTSGDVMLHYIKTRKETPSIYLAGTPELEKQFEAAGVTLLAPGCHTADFAVLGFDTTYSFEKADALCRLVSDGVPFLATNIDRVCPLEGGRFWPDCGSMAAMITHATGVEPIFVGKPFKETVDFILAYTGVAPGKTAMVGDRLYTDIKTAVNGGINGIAVLSGEIGYEDIEQGDVAPDYILNSVKDIYTALN